MKITINKKSLIDFQKRSSFMKPNKILPILSNVLISNAGSGWNITKTNLSAVVSGPIEVEGDLAALLIDERILFGFISKKKSDSITIERASGSTQFTISDGDTKVKLPIEDPAHFPKTPEFKNADITQLDTGHLRSFDIAMNFAKKDEMSGNYHFVHCVPGVGIFATDGFCFYLNTAFMDMPAAFLSIEECEAISSFDSVGFINADRHHIYFNSGYTYIFTKAEGKALNISQVAERLKLEGNAFTIQKSALIDFCNDANLVSESATTICVISSIDGGINLSMKDANFNRDIERSIELNGQPETFSFNSKLFAQPINAVPYETLKAKTNQNCLIFEGTGGLGGGLGSEVNEWFCFLGLANL